jgi:ribosomal-protein-alanine N-acetyltransferase
MFLIESGRLKLLPLNHEQLLLQMNNPNYLAEILGLQMPALKAPASFLYGLEQARDNCWLPDTQAYPDLYQWYTNWKIVLKNTNTIIGSIAFGGYPDDYGQTTVGYVIDALHNGNGNATEALCTLCHWGFRFSILKAVTADTEVANLASQKVLTKVGFSKTHVKDGTVFYRLRKSDLLNT